MAMEFEYQIVDVFSERPLAGNALCVVLDPVPDAVKQTLAREVNLSETTFPVVTGDDEYEMQIFTPHGEMSFAGHPSLGTAWVLGPKRWTQRTSGATVVVEADATGAVMTQPDPEFTEVDPGVAMRALGLFGSDGAWVSSAGGTRHLIVLADSPIHRLEPNMQSILTASQAVAAISVAVVERLNDTTLHARVFLPAMGIDEDPGTGSAAGPIGLLAGKKWGTGVDVAVRQGAEVGRPCVIEVHAEEGNVRVGGRVAQCARGHFTL
jgi:trans-2,3-dihydro-3-hydroxyanthranilate isomerase